jgi:hypothetical protein
MTAAGCDQSAKKPESWVSQTPTTWPQIVLTNEGKFRGHTSMEGASSFLIKAKDGRVFAVTAKHLLGEDGGVEPAVATDAFNNVLESWRLSARTKPKSYVEVEKLVAFGESKYDDWVVFSLKPKQDLPARPLRVREAGVELDETVYLLGVPYKDIKSTQNVYKGRAISGNNPLPYFLLQFSPAVDLSGFSGAPVVDGNGHLVGILTGQGSPFNRKKSTTEGRAQRVEDIYQWLESSN